MLRELEDLRSEIDRIDSEILKLVQKRLEIAREIAAIKAKRGLEVTDTVREKAVLESWLRRARSLNIPEDLAREMAELLMRYSRAIQRASGSRSRRVALVGYGRVARSLARLMLLAGHSVTVTGRAIERAESLARDVGCSSSSLEDAIEKSEYVILALSRRAFEDGFVDEMARSLAGRVVMDVLSSKKRVFEKMEELSLRHGFSYISTHPLFYPVDLPFGEKVVLIPSETGLSVLPEVARFWESLGLEVVVSTLDEHERAMAVQQVLPHVLMLALIEAREALSDKLGVEKPDRMETRNMRRLKGSLETLLANMDTVLEIQKHNPYAELARREALRALARVIERIEGEVVDDSDRG